MMHHVEHSALERPADRSRMAPAGKPPVAFTLVEVIVVALILGILAAVAVPAVINRAEQSKSRAMFSQAIAIERAASVYFGQYGKWPTTSYWGQTSLFDPYIHRSAFHRSQVDTNQPWGWIWLAPFSSYKAIVYTYSTTPPKSLWQQIDSDFDDGNLATGTIFLYQNNYLFYVVDK